MRNYSADALKAALIVLVVVGHIFLGSAEDVPQKGAIYLFHMPVFLALSGYFFAAQRSVIEEAGRAWRRYILAWLVASAAFFVLFKVVKGASPFGLREAFLLPWFHLWFVPALAIFSLTTAAIKNPVLVVCLWAAPVIAQAFGLAIPLREFGIDPRYLYFGLYFAIGYGSRHLFARRSPRPFIFALVPAIAVAPMLYPHFTTGVAVDVVRILVCVGSMALIASFPGQPNVVSNSIFARESLAIYLYHPVPLLFLKALEPRMGGILYWTLSLGVTLICVPVAISLLRRFKAMNIPLGEAPLTRP